MKKKENFINFYTSNFEQIIQLDIDFIKSKEINYLNDFNSLSKEKKLMF